MFRNDKIISHTCSVSQSGHLKTTSQHLHRRLSGKKKKKKSLGRYILGSGDLVSNRARSCCRKKSIARCGMDFINHFFSWGKCINVIK